MHSLSLLIGDTVIGLCIFVCILWILSKSPILSWFATLIFLLSLSITTPLASLFVAYLSFSEGNYWYGLWQLFLGTAISIPFIWICYPELIKLFKKDNMNFKIWK